MTRTMLTKQLGDDALEEMVMAQGLGDADRQAPGMKKAIVALARRLPVTTHRTGWTVPSSADQETSPAAA